MSKKIYISNESMKWISNLDLGESVEAQIYCYPPTDYIKSLNKFIEYSAYEQLTQRIAELEAEVKKLKKAYDILFTKMPCKCEEILSCDYCHIRSDVIEALEGCHNSAEDTSIPREDVDGLVKALKVYEATFKDKKVMVLELVNGQYEEIDWGNAAAEALTEFKAKHGGGNE